LVVQDGSCIARSHHVHNMLAMRVCILRGQFHGPDGRKLHRLRRRWLSRRMGRAGGSWQHLREGDAKGAPQDASEGRRGG
jgi:hypothetical protein